jgi:probable F420-dependent oxidoreductase
MTLDRGRLTLGLNLPYVEGSMDGGSPRWADMHAMAQTAEAIGFDAVWVSDHLGFGDPAGEWQGAWESWTLLSALAVATTRVELGNYVLAITLRHPAVLAKMAETLDEISGGRLILGIGAGWNEPEFTSFDLPFADRFDRFEDGIRVITSMLRTGRSTYDGRTIRTREARIEPRGPRPNGLPVMVGAGGPRMLRLTAELADHWNGGLAPFDEIPELLSRVDAACAAVGRDPRTLTRSTEVLVGTSAVDPAQPPEAVEIRGEPAAIAARLRAIGALGVDHLQVQLRPNSLAGVEAFAPIIEALRTG